MRTTVAGLPWKIPKSKIKDLVRYAVCRKNMRRSANGSRVAPKVAFTGRIPTYNREYGLSFGTYCETTDPKVESRNVEQSRTEACIALYPANNANQSWIFLNLKTNRYVRRSSWIVMNTDQLIIDRMNELADAEEDPREQNQLFDEEEAGEAQLHTKAHCRPFDY